MNITTPNQILIRMVAIDAADLALVGWIVKSSIESGISPDGSFQRVERPLYFWASNGLVMVIGAAFAAVLAYEVLRP